MEEVGWGGIILAPAPVDLDESICFVRKGVRGHQVAGRRLVHPGVLSVLVPRLRACQPVPGACAHPHGPC
jgi:hypothetical protein